MSRFNEAAGKSPRNPRYRQTPRSRAVRCFNEAAGKSPRNLRNAPLHPIWTLLLQMRPRGSPRGIAAGRLRPSRLAVPASMRPRGSPRGISHVQDGQLAMALASMRPRGSPRGITVNAPSNSTSRRCFNEAAGKSPRNRFPPRPRRHRYHRASMRPRGSPRGIPMNPNPLSFMIARFNEAAGKSPRNRASRDPRPNRRRSFNEAAGKSPRKSRASLGHSEEFGMLQ